MAHLSHSQTLARALSKRFNLPYTAVYEEIRNYATPGSVRTESVNQDVVETDIERSSSPVVDIVPGDIATRGLEITPAVYADILRVSVENRIRDIAEYKQVTVTIDGHGPDVTIEPWGSSAAYIEDIEFDLREDGFNAIRTGNLIKVINSVQPQEAEPSSKDKAERLHNLLDYLLDCAMTGFDPELEESEQAFMASVATVETGGGVTKVVFDDAEKLRITVDELDS